MKTKVFLLATLLGAQSFAAFTCDETLKGLDLKASWYERKAEEAKVDFFDVVKYLGEKNRAETWGRVESKYRDDLGTRLWYGALGSRTATGEVPLVDPNAKAVFLFFHGSGTMQSSGKNFFGNINTLANLGYSAVSFDMPFHAEGPIGDQFYDAAYFMKWIDKIVTEVKKSGKPVYLVGHSFGPDVIAEYLTKYPFNADGALMISPAGYNQTLLDWYDTHTAKMKFGGEVPSNTMAGIWADTVSKQFVWNKGGVKDPSVVNPNLKVHLLIGDREEYVPGPVGGPNKTPIGKNTYDAIGAYKKIISRVDGVLEEGIGHYIFNHLDKKGQNSVMRETLRLAGEDIKNAKALLLEQGTNLNMALPSEKLSFKYAFDRNFKSWVETTLGKQAVMGIANKRQSDYESTLILDRYETERKAYEQNIFQAVLQNPDKLAIFFANNEALIVQTKADPKKNANSLITVFGKYLNTLSEAQQHELLVDIKLAE